MRTLLKHRLPLLMAIFAACSLTQLAHSAPHQLREHGRTLLEAEDFSASSEQFPYAEPCRKCSGQKTLGFFWKNAWFDMQVDVSQMSNFNITLQASSLAGTRIQVYLVSPTGEEKPVATIDAPKTGGWANYIATRDAKIFLPSGIHVLRFKNLEEEAANIDYITFATGDISVVRPAINHGPDINPLKGFNSSWWRNEDYASVGFQYIEWKTLEPEDDVFNWVGVEEVLNREGTRGRHFILQFVVDWDGYEPVEANYLGPDWLLEKVKERQGNVDPDDPTSRQIRATDYNNPIFIEEATEAIEALLDHYRDDPRNFVVQVGVLGFWAEWHSYPRVEWSPTDETKAAILSAYLRNLSPEGLTQIRYPNEAVAKPRQGMGYINGSATLSDHGKEFGKAIADRELWKNGPVSGEWPPNVESSNWKQFFLTTAGEDFINEAHYTTLCPPEPKDIAKTLPGWSIDKRFMQMHRRMGYNFQVKEARHIVARNDTGRTHIEVDLNNVGIAPFYKNWETQLAILQTDTAEIVDVIETRTDLRSIGPGESRTISGSTSQKLNPHDGYQIALRILQPGADKTKTNAWKLNARNTYIALANEIKVTDGKWDKNNALQGGWNILDDMEHRKRPNPKSDFFPFEGSFRAVRGTE